MNLFRFKTHDNRLLVMGLCALFVCIFGASCFKALTPANSPHPPFGPPLSIHDAERARLRAIDVVKKLSVELYPLNYTQTKNQRKARDFIADHFRNAGLEVSFQEYKYEDYTFFNVIGFRKGRTRERIVIGAHYDTCADTPGADDNASGVAALIECAYLFQGVPETECDLEFVAYNTEEPPFFRTEHMGSAVHAKSIKDAGISLKMMFCMDLVGFYSDEPDSQTYPLPFMSAIYGNKADFIALIGPFAHFKKTSRAASAMSKATDLPVKTLKAPMTDTPGISWSDHRNYLKYDYPVLLITDTTTFRSDRYHQSTDTWNTLHYGNICKVARALSAAILALDVFP